MIQRIFPIVFILFILCNPAYLTTCYLFGIPPYGSIFRIYIGTVGVIAMVTSYFALRGKDINILPLLLSLIGFSILFFSTTIFYLKVSPFYYSHMLRWGASCIPALFLGLSFVYYEEKKKIIKYIPISLLILTPFVAFASFRSAKLHGQYVDAETGLNYQEISYYMAFFFSLSCYYLFIVKDRISSKLLSFVLYVLLITEGIVCSVSGGRGGFVLLIVNVLFFIYMIYKRGNINKGWFTIILVASCLLFIAIAIYFDLWSYEGFYRVTHPFAQNTGRTDDWQEVLTYFYQSPIIGNGLGSDFMTWGFYSHNIFVDFLAETGIVGFSILFSILIWMYWKVFKHCFIREEYFIIMCVGVYGIVHNCFSGYWISTYQIWMMLGVSYGIRMLNNK